MARLLLALILLSSTPLFASQPMETESARLLPAGTLKVELTSEPKLSLAVGLNCHNNHAVLLRSDITLRFPR